jgi:hypothetical protein
LIKDLFLNKIRRSVYSVGGPLFSNTMITDYLQVDTFLKRFLINRILMKEPKVLKSILHMVSVHQIDSPYFFIVDRLIRSAYQK